MISEAEGVVEEGLFLVLVSACQKVRKKMIEIYFIKVAVPTLKWVYKTVSFWVRYLEPCLQGEIQLTPSFAKELLKCNRSPTASRRSIVRSVFPMSICIYIRDEFWGTRIRRLTATWHGHSQIHIQLKVFLYLRIHLESVIRGAVQILAQIVLGRISAK